MKSLWVLTAMSLLPNKSRRVLTTPNAKLVSFSPPENGLRVHLVGLIVSAGLLLAIGQWSNWDLRLADFYFDVGSGTFPARRAWWATTLMHEWVKYMLIALGVGLGGLCAYDTARPVSCLEGGRRTRLRLIVLSAVMIPILIGLVKKFSFSHCPWDVLAYGGYAPYVRILDAIPLHVDAGNCMPAGHASSGLWLASLGLLWWPKQHGRALLVSLAGLLVGAALGWVQQMRGAHFLTHTLWSMWMTWAWVVGLAAYLAYRQR